jgi:hypothetical protein
MVKVGNVAGLTSAQSLVQERHIKSQGKKTAQHDQHESSTELTTGSDH